MLWSFIAVCLSAWLSVDASYRGPTGNAGCFKPLTLLLLLLLARQAPMFDAISYLVLAGCVLTAGRCANPVATSTSDVRHRRVFPLAPAVHHLFRQSDDALFLLASAVGAAGSGRAAPLAIIWTRLEEYRWPICTFIGMTLVMVWLAGELWFFRPTAPALSAFVGASLLFISNFVWLVVTIADASVRITPLPRPATLLVTSSSSARCISDKIDSGVDSRVYPSVNEKNLTGGCHVDS